MFNRVTQGNHHNLLAQQSPDTKHKNQFNLFSLSLVNRLKDEIYNPNTTFFELNELYEKIISLNFENGDETELDTRWLNNVDLCKINEEAMLFLKDVMGFDPFNLENLVTKGCFGHPGLPKNPAQTPNGRNLKHFQIKMESVFAKNQIKISFYCENAMGDMRAAAIFLGKEDALKELSPIFEEIGLEFTSEKDSKGAVFNLKQTIWSHDNQGYSLVALFHYFPFLLNKNYLNSDGLEKLKQCINSIWSEDHLFLASLFPNAKSPKEIQQAAAQIFYSDEAYKKAILNLPFVDLDVEQSINPDTEFYDDAQRPYLLEMRIAGQYWFGPLFLLERLS